MANGKIDKALQQCLKDSMKIKRLWKNASPNSSFAPQGLTIDITGFDIIRIVHKTYTNGTLWAEITDDTPVAALDGGYGILIFGAFCQSGSSTSTRGYSVSRRYAKENGQLVFRDAAVTKELTTANDSKQCIPLEIYGIKIIGGGAVS